MRVGCQYQPTARSESHGIAIPSNPVAHAGRAAEAMIGLTPISECTFGLHRCLLRTNEDFGQISGISAKIR